MTRMGTPPAKDRQSQRGCSRQRWPCVTKHSHCLHGALDPHGGSHFWHICAMPSPSRQHGMNQVANGTNRSHAFARRQPREGETTSRSHFSSCVSGFSWHSLRAAPQLPASHPAPLARSLPTLGTLRLSNEGFGPCMVLARGAGSAHPSLAFPLHHTAWFLAPTRTALLRCVPSPACSSSPPQTSAGRNRWFLCKVPSWPHVIKHAGTPAWEKKQFHIGRVVGKATGYIE